MPLSGGIWGGWRRSPLSGRPQPYRGVRVVFQPEAAVMLADTPYDIESAFKAGVGVIAFRCGGFDDSQLKDAIAIYNDPADLLAQYDSSPLASVAAIEA